MKGSESFRMEMHPQGYYLAVINQYRVKKQLKYGVELFDLSQVQNQLVPH